MLWMVMLWGCESMNIIVFVIFLGCIRLFEVSVLFILVWGQLLSKVVIMGFGVIVLMCMLCFDSCCCVVCMKVCMVNLEVVQIGFQMMGMMLVIELVKMMLFDFCVIRCGSMVWIEWNVVLMFRFSMWFQVLGFFLVMLLLMQVLVLVWKMCSLFVRLRM